MSKNIKNINIWDLVIKNNSKPSAVLDHYINGSSTYNVTIIGNINNIEVWISSNNDYSNSVYLTNLDNNNFTHIFSPGFYWISIVNPSITINIPNPIVIYPDFTFSLEDTTRSTNYNIILGSWSDVFTQNIPTLCLYGYLNSDFSDPPVSLLNIDSDTIIKIDDVYTLPFTYHFNVFRNYYLSLGDLNNIFNIKLSNNINQLIITGQVSPTNVLRNTITNYTIKLSDNPSPDLNVYYADNNQTNNLNKINNVSINSDQTVTFSFNFRINNQVYFYIGNDNYNIVIDTPVIINYVMYTINNVGDTLYTVTLGGLNNTMNITSLYLFDTPSGNLLLTITNFYTDDNNNFIGTFSYQFTQPQNYVTICTTNDLSTGVSYSIDVSDSIGVSYSIDVSDSIGVSYIAPEGNNNLSDNLFRYNSSYKSSSSPNLFSSNSSTPVVIGTYTYFDTPPNRTTPSNFLETYGLYSYNTVPSSFNPNGNFNGYLILQSDAISNGVPQTSTTLDSFTTFLISQLANKQINLITVPTMFLDQYTSNNFVTNTHTFEYYNSETYNGEQINKQSSLCTNVVQNNQLITNISTIQLNFLQSYNNEVRNYTGQNTLNTNTATLTAKTSNPPRFSWIENLGYYIAQYFQLSINNVEIEKLTSDWINIWNEVNLPPGKVSGNNKMIGNVPALTAFNSNTLPTYKLRLPIPFYFNRYNNAGLSIPLISLLHSDVKLTIQLEKLENLIISDPLTKFITSGRPKLNLELKYIYLDSEERRRFATSKHEYLIEQENYRNYSHYGTYFNTKLNLKQPVKDLYWFCQPKANTTNANNKQYWNYTNSKYYKLLSNYDRYDEVNPITTLSKQVYANLYTKYPDINYIPMYINNQLSKSDVPYPTKSPINKSTLVLNGQWRFKDDGILTQLQYFHKYNNIPLSGINVYPFCLYPNEYQPSGACNFSALADAYFTMNTDDGAYNVGIIARNYNLLRIMSGQAGLAFEL